MQDVAVDRARIIAPPPVIYLAILSLGLLLERLRLTQLLSRPLAVTWGQRSLFVVWSVGLTGAIRTVWRAQTPFDPCKPTTGIVTDGLFRFSRNPIHISDTLFSVSLSLALNAWWALALTPVLARIMPVGVITREEEYLQPKFGNEYLQYKRQVRRWL